MPLRERGPLSVRPPRSLYYALGNLTPARLAAAARALRPLRGIMAPPAGTPARFMLVTDLDGTLVDPNDESHVALRRFNALWRKYCFDARLVYSTGRSQQKYQQLLVRGAAVAAAAARKP